MYNKQLIGRGTMIVHPTFFQTWVHDVDRMNAGKEGRPFKVPDSCIQWLAFCRTRFKGLDYRTLQGFAEGFIENAKPALRAWGMGQQDLDKIQAPSFSQIRRRIKTLKLDPKTISLLEEGEAVEIILDASGVKVTNRGEWIRRHGKGRQKKGWLKIHLGIDRNHQQTTALITTTERVGDVREGPRLTQRSANHVRARRAKPVKEYADGAYDSRHTFDACNAEGIRPVIRPRAGSSRKKRGGTMERPKRVREFERLGYDDWAGYLDYGYRWLIESKFSSVKRTTGEYVTSREWHAMVQETRLKFWAHDAMLYHDHAGRSPWDP